MSTSSPPPPAPASPEPEPVTPPSRVAASDPIASGTVRTTRTSPAPASPTPTADVVVPLEVPAREDGDPVSFQRNATLARLAIEQRQQAIQRLN